MPLTALSLAVVGADFENKRGPGRRFEIQLCAPGEPVTLTPEPKNPADTRAVAVYSVRGVQLGYVTAERASLIGGILASGREVQAVFQEKTQYGAVIRVAFDGAVPVLPIKPPKIEGPGFSQEFWPDDEYPDE